MEDTAWGLGERFAHLDMVQYRTTMPAAGHLFFVSYVGMDRLGFTDKDFEDLWDEDLSWI